MFREKKKEQQSFTNTFFKMVGGVELTLPTIQTELEELKKAKQGEDRAPSKPAPIRKPRTRI